MYIHYVPHKGFFIVSIVTINNVTITKRPLTRMRQVGTHSLTFVHSCGMHIIVHVLTHTHPHTLTPYTLHIAHYTLPYTPHTLHLVHSVHLYG